MNAPSLTVPEPLADDTDDIVTSLETAAVFNAQGDLREAVRWVRRAAEAASDAGNDLRALALARAVADLNIGASVTPTASQSAVSAPSQSAAPSQNAAPAGAPIAAPTNGGGAPASISSTGSVRPSPVVRVEAGPEAAAPPPPPPLPTAPPQLAVQPLPSAAAQPAPPPLPTAPAAEPAPPPLPVAAQPAAAPAPQPAPPPLPMTAAQPAAAPSAQPATPLPFPEDDDEPTPFGGTASRPTPPPAVAAAPVPDLPPLPSVNGGNGSSSAMVSGNPRGGYASTIVGTPAPVLSPVPPAVAAPVVAAAPIAPAAVTAPSIFKAVRASVQATGEDGVFRLTLLKADESVSTSAHEALLVLLDPETELFSARG